jgi:hypothetical protein
METRYMPLPDPDPGKPRIDALAGIFEDDPNWQNGMLSDISAGGARLHGRMQVTVDHWVGLLFTPPSDFLAAFATRKDEKEYGPNGPRIKIVEERPKTFPTLLLRGKIINVSLSSQSRQFIHNIQFFRLRPGDRDQLERFIIMRQRYELKSREEMRHQKR